MTRPTIFTISATWDVELGLWLGVCDAIPAAAEAPTLDELLERVGSMTADLLADNRPDLDPAFASRHAANAILKQAELPKAF